MESSARPRPAVFRALGKAEPPECVEIEGRLCHRVTVYKHDSWAATARYRGFGVDVVCKFNRVQPILGLPMEWLGELLARRERRALQRLVGIPGIPRECGPIRVEGKRSTNAVGHDYVPGRPMTRNDRLSATFASELRQLIDAVHARDMAYVDLHKRENVLVGDDGLPHLIDFQVSAGLWLPHQKQSALQRTLLGLLQKTDLYHLHKHDRSEKRESQAVKPWWIRLHRMFAIPCRGMRRRLLSLIGVRGKTGRADSEAFAEEAIRQERKAA